MIKTLLRYALLIVLCGMFVYAPEILSAVSAPYALAPSERTLLRIALQCDSDTAKALHETINLYQKKHPHVHLRVVHAAEDQLAAASAPYPDVIVCPAVFSDQLPAVFDVSSPLSPEYAGFSCALFEDSPPAAAEFAAFIYEALSAQNPPSEN